VTSIRKAVDSPTQLIRNNGFIPEQQILRDPLIHHRKEGHLDDIFFLFL
jgi:hypothetical protein